MLHFTDGSKHVRWSLTSIIATGMLVAQPSYAQSDLAHALPKQSSKSTPSPIGVLRKGPDEAPRSALYSDSGCRGQIVKNLPPMASEASYGRAVDLEWAKSNERVQTVRLSQLIGIEREGAEAAVGKKCGSLAPQLVAQKRVVDALGNFNVDLRPNWRTNGFGWPTETGLSAGFAAALRDCRARMEAQDGDDMLSAIIYHVRDEANAAAVIDRAQSGLASDMASSYRMCLFGKAQTSKDAAAYEANLDISDAAGAGHAYRAKNSFIYEARDILIAKRPRVTPAQLQQQFDAANRQSSPDSVCGTPNLSYPSISSSNRSNVSSQFSRNQTIGMCLQNFANSGSGSSVQIGDLANWARAARPFTCGRWSESYCLPDSEHEPWWQYASPAAVDRLETLANGDAGKARARSLMSQIETWSAETNRRIDAYNRRR